MSYYLVLVSMRQSSAALVERIKGNLVTLSEVKADPLWIDSKYFGIPVETDKCAAEIVATATHRLDGSDIANILAIELGKDWYAKPETKTAGWLKTHLGRPRIV